MFRRTMLGASFALVGPLAFGSCVDDSVSLRIVCKKAPDSGGECTYSEAGACFLVGALNVAGRSSYDGVLLVTNGLKPRARDIPPLSEPNGVLVYELEIEVLNSAGKKPNLGSLPNPFTVPASGFAEPNSDALVGAELLPRAYVERIARNEGTRDALGTARLNIIARGRTSGDVEVESQTFPWPVRILAVSLDAAENVCIQKEDAVCGIGQDTEVGTCYQTTE